MNIFRKARFGDWLRKAFLFFRGHFRLWFAYVLVVAFGMMITGISQALGILFAVTSLFLGVAIAKYADIKETTPESTITLTWAINNSLPLSVIAGLAVMVFGFVVSTVVKIADGDYAGVFRYFFYFQLSPDVLDRVSLGDLGAWLFGYANLSLIFVLLMSLVFASWFSFPLMLFKGLPWSRAKLDGKQEEANCRDVLYKTVCSLVVTAFLCIELAPLLTPVLYAMTSILIFISYRDYFER